MKFAKNKVCKITCLIGKYIILCELGHLHSMLYKGGGGRMQLNMVPAYMRDNPYSYQLQS